jgi:hypothetical protein
VDGSDQVANATECSSADALSSDFRKPAFDLIEPGRAGWGEMDVISRSCRGMLVRPVVVENQMDVQSRVDGLVDPAEKPAGAPKFKTKTFL